MLATRRKRTGKDVSTDKVSGEGVTFKGCGVSILGDVGGRGAIPHRLVGYPR